METKDVKSVLVLIDAAWSEVDWIVPVLHYIKDDNPTITISVVFNSYDSEYIMRDNTFLYELLLDSVHNCWDLNSFLPRSLKRLAALVKPRTYAHNLATRVIWYARYRVLDVVHRCVVRGLEETIVKVTQPDVLLKEIAMVDTTFRGKITSLVRERGGRIILFPIGPNVFLDTYPPEALGMREA